MSFPVARPSTSASETTTTSTIHEYICLFTHDLKRKSKRWQDGRLKYHLFNNRIMVYDDRGGTVGDAHWTANMSSVGSDLLEEGDEFDLDRGAAIVQVCEWTGSKEVDLKELVDKRVRDVEKRRREAAVKTPSAAASGSRPLNAMVTPARIGRAAVPKESPYEQRMQREQQQQQREGPPPAKRVRREASPPSKSTHARALFGTQLTLSTPGGSWGRSSQALRDRTNVRAQAMSSSHGEEEVQEVARREGSKENVIHGRGIRETSPDEERSLFLEDRPSVKPTVGSTSSRRLGGLRIERPGNGQRPPTKQVKPSIRQPAAHPTVRRASPTSSPTDLTMDDDPPPHESSPPVSKKSKVTAKPAATSRPQHSTTERASLAREETAHVAPRSKQPPPLPAPSAATSRQKPHNELPASMAASPAPDRKDERRTELRIKTRKRRGLLMLAQPDPVDEQREADKGRPTEPEIKESATEAADAGFEAWLEDDGDDVDAVGLPVSLPTEAEVKGVTHRPSPREEKGENLSPAADIQPMDDPLDPAQKAAEEQDALERRTSQDVEGPKRPSPRRSPKRRSPDGPTSSNHVVQQDRDASPAADTAGNDAPNPSGQRENDTHQTRRPLRSTKQTAKPAITIPITSPASPPAPASDPEPTYLHSSESEDDWAGPPPQPPSRSRSSRSKQAAAPSNEASKASPPRSKPAALAKNKKRNDTGIRVSRISRSCKSKVITGFMEDDSEGFLQAGGGMMGWGSATMALAANETAVLHKNEPVAEDEKRTTAEDEDEDKEANTVVKPPTRRISNPATRGRKAASKGDAAGQVLQVAVPFDQPQPQPRGQPPAPAHRVRKGPPSGGEEAASSSSATDSTTAVTQGAREKKELPGFARANGGPWSRHADDLLGMGKPKRKQRR